jgi:glycosyltransferase involved in cell wall biosynthesis
MRVLYFAPKECWPTTTGARVRNYHLARALARNADVTYLSFSDSGGGDGRKVSIVEPDPRASALGSEMTSSNGSKPQRNTQSALSWCDRLIHVPQERGYTPMKLARGALGRTPVTVLNYTSRAMARGLEELLNSQEFDVVQVESVHLASYLPVMRAARNRPLVICDWHNIESNLMAQYSARVSNPLRRAYARRTAIQIAALERRVAHAVDGNVLVSDPDRERLLSFASDVPAFVIQNGVDVDHYSDEQIERAYEAWHQHNSNCGNAQGESTKETCLNHEVSRRKRVLFVGSMDYHANVDGAVSFTRTTWPRVLQQLPELRLTIVGRDPTAEVRSLADLRGVEVTGTVEDIRPYYREALVSVVPLTVGGGSRLKICEAMAAGVPVLSTRLGAEGIDVNHEENIIFAETADEFCGAIQTIAGDDQKRQHLAAAGRRLVSTKYDWRILGGRLEEIHRNLVSSRRSTVG